MVQAEKFGARLCSPCVVEELTSTGDGFEVTLRGGLKIGARAVIVATGARYRALPIANWADFEGAGIYYAATEIEAKDCATEDVMVVGGANSSGQAALFLASRGSAVTIVARRPDLRATMSSYLVDRLEAHPMITIRTNADVVGLEGGRRLERVRVAERCTGAAAWQPSSGLFCFIGAEPSTDWLSRGDGASVSIEDDGSIPTDHDLTPVARAAFAALGRHPLAFETSIPGVFAVGDVRKGSMKRVAGAVGEGAGAVRSVHAALAHLGAPSPTTS